MLRLLLSFRLLTLLFVSIFLFSCDSDDDTANPTSCDKVTAKISGALTLNFSSCNVIFSKFQATEFLQRTIVAKSTVGNTAYTLIITIHDKGTGKGTYKLDVNEGQILFSVNEDPNKTYNTFPDGEITLTQVTDNSWVGSFHAEITCGTNQEKIKIVEGKINIK